MGIFKMKKSISIVIPAYNEEKEIESTLRKVNSLVTKLFDDYELLIFDDGSKDKTGEIADKLSKLNPKIRVFHNRKNMNTGYNFRTGIKYATKEYAMLLPAPDNVQIESLENFLKCVGKKSIIMGYIINKNGRPLYRRFISFCITNTLNLLFGLHLKYFFGHQAYKSSLVKKIKTSTNSFGLLPELIIRILKENNDYLEIPYYVRVLKENKTTAFRINNVKGVLSVILRLFFEINFAPKKGCYRW